jgi:L-lactate dehydrogenase complex protein LldG
MLQRFTAELAAQTGVTHRADDGGDALRILGEIAAAEGIKTVVAAGEPLPGVDLEAFGKKNGIVVTGAAGLKDREGLREVAFTADAGITFADFAVAETGTIGLIFGKSQPRLVSIAPPVQIAVIPVERLYPIYEDVIDQVFASPGAMPSQFAFITGPSSTGDIQGVHFKGMHGPMKVFVIFVTGRG